MKIGILRVTGTYELTIVKYSETNDKYSVVVSFSLNTKTPLSECESKVKTFGVDELWFVPLARIINKESVNAHILGSFNVGNIKRYITLADKDIEKVKEVAEKCSVKSLRIFSMYDIFGKMTRTPIILVADYHGQYIYLYYDKGVLKDARINVNADSFALQAMKQQKNVNAVFPIYNNTLNTAIEKKVVNWNDFELTHKTFLGISMGTVLIEPKINFISVNGILIEDVANKKEAVQTPSPVKEKVKKVEVSPKPFIRKTVSPSHNTDKNEKEPTDKKAKMLNIGLSAIGLGLSMLVGASIFCNKQLPSDIEYLQGKQEELTSLVNPKQNTLDYYNKFIESDSTGGNYDNDYATRIKGVALDGVLAEVRLQQNEVGVVVYLKDPAKIDELTNSFGEIFEVTQVVNKGTASLDNTTLTKFYVNGIR